MYTNVTIINNIGLCISEMIRKQILKVLITRKKFNCVRWWLIIKRLWLIVLHIFNHVLKLMQCYMSIIYEYMEKLCFLFSKKLVIPFLSSHLSYFLFYLFFIYFCSICWEQWCVRHSLVEWTSLGHTHLGSVQTDCIYFPPQKISWIS